MGFLKDDIHIRCNGSNYILNTLLIRRVHVHCGNLKIHKEVNG